MKHDRLNNWLMYCDKSKLWLWSFERSLLVPKNNAMGVEDESLRRLGKAKEVLKKLSGGYL